MFYSVAMVGSGKEVKEHPKNKSHSKIGLTISLSNEKSFFFAEKQI